MAIRNTTNQFRYTGIGPFDVKNSPVKNLSELNQFTDDNFDFLYDGMMKWIVDIRKFYVYNSTLEKWQPLIDDSSFSQKEIISSDEDTSGVKINVKETTDNIELSTSINYDEISKRITSLDGGVITF